MYTKQISASFISSLKIWRFLAVTSKLFTVMGEALVYVSASYMSLFRISFISSFYVYLHSVYVFTPYISLLHISLIYFFYIYLNSVYVSTARLCLHSPFVFPLLVYISTPYICLYSLCKFILSICPFSV